MKVVSHLKTDNSSSWNVSARGDKSICLEIRTIHGSFDVYLDSVEAENLKEELGLCIQELDEIDLPDIKVGDRVRHLFMMGEWTVDGIITNDPHLPSSADNDPNAPYVFADIVMGSDQFRACVPLIELRLV